MIVTHWSCALTGLQPRLVQVEVDLSNGLPGCRIVGLPDSTVQEARERIRAAIRNSGYDFPFSRITINLAPADFKKEGSAFDLSMALGILGASGQIPDGNSKEFMIVGELGFDGSVRSVPGILAMAGISEGNERLKMIVPFENGEEVSTFPNLQVWSVKSLQQAIAVLSGDLEPLRQHHSWTPNESWPDDFQSVKGQDVAKRAFEIAAAGNHNVILVGPPGSGKTMLAYRLVGILPPLHLEEALEVSKIRSISGAEARGLARTRPFRTPHCSMSYAGMVGGGNPVRPGELSLAHRGVLFMDEVPEFSRNVLEALRQPLEEKRVTVVRLSGALTYPADFLFVGAMNPCPCGFYGDTARSCICSPSSRLHYRQRLSGPVLDRIDLHVEVTRLTHEQLYGEAPSEKTEEIRKRILAARLMQSERFESNQVTNSGMKLDAVERHCVLSVEGKELLGKAYDKLHFSTRGHVKILKIARTIADLANSQEIQVIHLAEALQYRVLDRTVLS